jgi:protein TonB
MPVLQWRIFMERPSHSIIALSAGSGSRRFLGAGFTLVAQGMFVAVVVGGLVIRANVPDPIFNLVPEARDTRPSLPPPPVRQITPARPTVAPPLIDIAPAQSSSTEITAVVPQQPPANPPVAARPPQKPPGPADRPASGIAATHTVPVYPTLARRLGVEGKVTLRLTVMPDGHVGQADIVASSGRRDLDQAAQAWIVGHWTYSPAIRGGVPAASQVMAAVEFTLTNAK